MLEIENKIRELQNESMRLKMNSFEKKDNTISYCSKLINENKLLKSKVNKLELIARKFFTREKSFNMLLENQLFENKRNAFGLAKVSKYEQTTNNIVKGNSVIPKQVKTITIWVPKGTNIRSLKVKQIWVLKGTYINSFGSPQTYFSNLLPLTSMDQ